MIGRHWESGSYGVRIMRREWRAVNTEASLRQSLCSDRREQELISEMINQRLTVYLVREY